MLDGFTQTDLASRVEEIVRQHVDSETELPLEADLLNDLAIDSLELVELGIKLEKTLGIKLSIADLRRCVTLEEVIQLVQQAAETNQVKSL
jgi:acyl carrier protein